MTEHHGDGTVAQADPHHPACDQTVRFSTADREEAHAKLVDLFVEHELLFGDDRPMNFQLEVVPARTFVLSRLQFAVDIAFSAPPMKTVYQVNIPLRGTCDLAQRGPLRSAVAGQAGVTMIPDAPVSFHWDERAIQYAMKFPRESLQAHAARLTGLERVESIEFEMSFDIATPTGRALLSTADFMFNEFGRAGGINSVPLVRDQLESAFMTQVLCAVPNQLTPLLNRKAGSSGRDRINDVIAYIDLHPDKQLETADLAEMSQMGPRALQMGFREVVGVSPTAYVRGVRLDRVRQDLLSGSSVTEAAMRWGFFHLGHFGQHYRKRFGVTPSETARRGG